MNINRHKAIIGYPLAAPLSGKDTVQKGLRTRCPHIAVIHMSTLLDIIIEHNEEYKQLRQKGGLLPPEEAVKAFRRGFLETTRGLGEGEVPHIFANGACREEYETKSNIGLVRRTKSGLYQQVGFRFLLDKEHILSRAAERVRQAQDAGQKPRKEDLGDTPLIRYSTFQTNLEPVLRVFEQQGGVVINIDANREPDQVLQQVVAVYDAAKDAIRAVAK